MSSSRESAASSGPGQLVVISGPSGVGKSTIVANLIQECPLPLELSVSCTTRPRRPGERDGVHYHYLSEDEFARRRDGGEFLEAIEVFGRGHWYGTLKETVTSGLRAGKWIILEIDVDGADKVLEVYPDARTLFIHPGSLAELERRLRGRGTDSEQAIQRRLAVARHELDAADRYQQVVVNETVSGAVAEICQWLMHAEKETDVR